MLCEYVNAGRVQLVPGPVRNFAALSDHDATAAAEATERDEARHFRGRY